LAILERISELLKRGDQSVLASHLEELTLLTTNDRDEALGALVDLLVQRGRLHDGPLFYDAILKREEIVSTGIGMGVAIPHAKLDCFSEFFISVGIHQGEGIEWDALDGAPVRLIFLIGGPADAQSDYLAILSHLTAAIKDADVRSAMLQATTVDDLRLLFNGKE
jgi:PTS system nitrogen regulatory IIA component